MNIRTAACQALAEKMITLPEKESGANVVAAAVLARRILAWLLQHGGFDTSAELLGAMMWDGVDNFYACRLSEDLIADTQDDLQRHRASTAILTALQRAESKDPSPLPARTAEDDAEGPEARP